MRGDPLYAVGDGCRTIEELLADVNRDPRRGDDPALPLFPVVLDTTTLATLARQGYACGSVPPAGERVLLQRNGNLSRDVTDAIHPENRALCLLTARSWGST